MCCFGCENFCLVHSEVEVRFPVNKNDELCICFYFVLAGEVLVTPILCIIQSFQLSYVLHY